MKTENEEEYIIGIKKLTFDKLTNEEKDLAREIYLFSAGDIHLGLSNPPDHNRALELFKRIKQIEKL